MSDTASSSKPFGSFERSLAWRYLRARREHGGAAMVSIISFVGIALAVTALIVIMSVMSGFRSTLLNTLLGGSGQVFVTTQGYTQDEALDIAGRIESLEGIEAVLPMIQGQVLASSRGANSGALVRGIRPEDIGVMKFREGGVESATAAGFGEGRNGGNVILMGEYLARALRVQEGSVVTLIAPEGASTAFGRTPRRKDYHIGALFKTGNVEIDQAYILMPMEQAQLFFNAKGVYPALDVRLDDIMATKEARDVIDEEFGHALLLDDWKRQRASYFNALEVEASMMRMIMLILITITSLNIITGVVMLVKNKTRDIAILRTIGTGRSAVMRVFVMIGASLGFFGAITGLALGVFIVLNIDGVEWLMNTLTGRVIFDPETYGIEGLPAELNLKEALFTTGWAVGMSILVTLWPAWRAAKLDPVEALRFE